MLDAAYAETRAEIQRHAVETWGLADLMVD
jgi:hypothetical protein